MRLDIFISQEKNISRNQAEILIKKEMINIDGKIIKKNGFNISGNEKIIISDLPEKLFNAIPKKQDLNIVIEDENLLVLNKEKGRQVYPGAEGDMENTILSGLRFYFLKDDLDKKIFSDKDLKVDHIGFIHRLDKNTSGTILISKVKENLKYFAKQFENREVEKFYLTIVKGKTPKVGEINSPIKRDEKERKKMTISSKGKNALTKFQTIFYDSNLDISFLKVQILTGRTHQIRVHFSSINFPIIGDEVYGNEKINTFFEEKYGISSQILHSFSIKIKLLNGKNKTFISKISNDFEKIIDKSVLKDEKII